jgi:Spy/CpxP family protein refolding chaperone
MFQIYSRIAVCAVAAMLVWMPVSAQANRGHSGHDGIAAELHGIVHHAKDLGLSDEQVTKFRSLISTYEKARINGETNVQLAEVDVQSLIQDEKADMAAIESAIRKSETAQANARIEGVKAIKAARTILTPEQVQKWRATRGTRQGEGKGRGEPTPPGQEPPKS